MQDFDVKKSKMLAIFVFFAPINNQRQHTAAFDSHCLAYAINIVRAHVRGLGDQISATCRSFITARAIASCT